MIFMVEKCKSNISYKEWLLFEEFGNIFSDNNVEQVLHNSLG